MFVVIERVESVDIPTWAVLCWEDSSVVMLERRDQFGEYRIFK